MKVKITKTAVEKLEPPETGERLVWDTALPGFGVRVVPSGTVSYIVQRRVNGKQRRMTLGRHTVLTAEQARKRAIVKLGEMADGVDHVKERKKGQALSVTLEEVMEGYLTDRTDLKERSKADIRRHVNKTFQAWANKPVTEITRDKVARRFQELSASSPAQANQAFRNLRALLNYARARYRTPDDETILPENPVSVLSESKLWKKIRARNSYVPVERVGEWWNTLQALRHDPAQTKAGRTGADIIAFLLLTGLRWSEAAELEWQHVEKKAGTLRLIDPKNRSPVTLPLSDGVLALLALRPKGRFVFPGRNSDKPVNDARPTLRKIETATGIGVTPHDLRRTFRAVAGRCGIELWKTKLLMNHTLSGDVTIDAYTDTENLQYLRPEANAIAGWIEGQGSVMRVENVTTLPKIRA
ncbi:integrase [Natronocella acetinitrilica]|uniref:Integrase n=1 Tax=Natronocella acetinitrilica TaxID=414046 RepID=A0AAE3KCJ4_9GAMM|nr:integrase family protein [Natronocella acetinitrilica]MCP1675033.1 integrase [Natronocella acetinitrilica]